MEKKCKFFYNILLEKKIHVPCYRSYVNRRFDICENSWKNIYHNRITLFYDKVIAEFNYKLLNNLLCNNLYVSKWKREITRNCTFCKSGIENTEHLIFECENVKNMWLILSAILRIDIRWKHILLGFYNESYNKVIFLNNLILYTALKIYKYKMYCRLEQLDETEYNIRLHLKKSLKLWFNSSDRVFVYLTSRMHVTRRLVGRK